MKTATCSPIYSLNFSLTGVFSLVRQTIKPQIQLGEVDISAITFNPKSRDDIPRLLRAFQHIWVTPELKKAVFHTLEPMIPASRDNGRPGMDL